MYRAVIFDVDGTLVDSNDAHAHAWVLAITDSGRRVEFSRVRPLIGMGGDKLLPEVTGLSIDSPEGKAIAPKRQEIFRRDFLPHLQPTRGAQRLLESLRDDHKTLVVASSAEEIIGLRSGGWSDEELKGAIAVYADPVDLLEHYDLSPFKRPLPVRSA